MSLGCILCGGKLVATRGVACPGCALRAAEFLLNASVTDVATFWLVGSSFEATRQRARAKAITRDVPEAGTIYAGLATGYLGVDLTTDALVTAASGIMQQPDLRTGCWECTEILFSTRLFRVERSTDLRALLAAY